MSHPQTVQTRFLQLRAEGKSYRAIAAELHVGRSTLLDWGRQFQADIDALRAIRIEALPIPDDFTDPDDQTLPPDLTTPIPAHPPDPDPETETKTRPKSDHPAENQKPYGNSNATHEGNIKGAVSPPNPDHAADEPPPPPKANDPRSLLRYHAAKHEYQIQRDYQKFLQSMSPEDLFRQCEILIDQKYPPVTSPNVPELLPPQPPTGTPEQPSRPLNVS